MGGVRSGVNRTPTFFVGGKRHDEGADFESLAASIEVVRRQFAGELLAT